MEFGVFLPSHGPAKSPEAVKQVAQAAEQANYDAVWAADHVLVHERHRDFCLIEAFVTLGYVAGITQRITLGTTVIVLPQRDPILVAKQAAAIDQYSNGRLILGIGVGWMEDEYRYLRTDFHQRGRMMDEWMQVMRTLWTDEKPSFHGEWINFEQCVFEPKPVQGGGPPLTIGGNSDAAIRRAANSAEGWQPFHVGPDEVKADVTKLREWAGGRKVQVIFHGRTLLGDKTEPELPISGPASAVIDTVGRYKEAGVDHLLFDFRCQTANALQRQLETMATDVIPTFQSSSAR